MTGGRLDSYGWQSHFTGPFMASEVDWKWAIWEVRRLGLIPEVTELNCFYSKILPKGTGYTNGSPEAQHFCVNYMLRNIYTWMTQGGLKDITFWGNAPIHTGDLIINGWSGNQKTEMYRGLLKLYTDVAPATSWPTAHRLNFALFDRPAEVTTTQTTSGSCPSLYYCSGNYGTPGLMTVPWSAYYYRADPRSSMTQFSQTAWTFDYQFYTQGTTGGDIFKAVDGSSNQLILINWNASNGNVTVTIGGATPQVVGTITSSRYNGLVITKNDTTFSLSLNGGTVYTVTATIAPIATLQFLDNTGSNTLAQQVNHTTFDVYESSSIVAGTSAIQALSTFQGNALLSFSDIYNWVIP